MKGRGGARENRLPTIITAAPAVTLYYVEDGDKFSKVRETIPRRNCRGDGGGRRLRRLLRASKARSALALALGRKTIIIEIHLIAI